MFIAYTFIRSRWPASNRSVPSSLMSTAVARPGMILVRLASDRCVYGSTTSPLGGVRTASAPGRKTA